jgi:hypothetical protein
LINNNKKGHNYSQGYCSVVCRFLPRGCEA